MADNSTDTKILPKDKQAITDGANWLSEWITERYNQGVLSDAEYGSAINRLKNVKVFVADDPYEGIVVALEKGELHLKKDAVKKYSKAHKDAHFELKTADLTDEQHAIAYLKESLSSQRPLGLYAKFFEESTVIIDANRINEKSEKEYYFSLTSATIHELTHNLELRDQEKAIGLALYGVSIKKDFQKVDEKIKAPTIEPEIAFLETSRDTVSPSKKKVYMYPKIELKEGVEYNQYLDKKEEVYARLMQLRYDFGLKPDETFTKEQIDEIERRAKASKEKFEAGDTTNKTDIDFLIVSRYRNNTIRDMLNYTAEEKTEVKSSFKVQEWQSKRLMAQQKDNTENQESVEKKESKALDTSIVIQQNHGRDFA